jgi:hypothetical protein
MVIVHRLLADFAVMDFLAEEEEEGIQAMKLSRE